MRTNIKGLAKDFFLDKEKMDDTDEGELVRAKSFCEDFDNVGLQVGEDEESREFLPPRMPKDWKSQHSMHLASTS